MGITECFDAFLHNVENAWLAGCFVEGDNLLEEIDEEDIEIIGHLLDKLLKNGHNIFYKTRLLRLCLNDKLKHWPYLLKDLLKELVWECSSLFPFWHTDHDIFENFEWFLETLDGTWVVLLSLW